MCRTASFAAVFATVLVIQCEGLLQLQARYRSGRFQRSDARRAKSTLGQKSADVMVLPSHYGEAYVNWSLCNATYQSNLGGVGPDGGEESLRYFNVATVEGNRSVDLVVTAVGDYRAYNASVNGLVGEASCFGVINLKASANAVLLNFELVLHDTNTPVAFDKSYFTVYDLDGSRTGQEAVTFHDTVNEYFLPGNSEWREIGSVASGLTFMSTTRGSGCDNPTDPEKLTERQKRRSVTVDYERKSQWQVTFAVNGGTHGRNLVFASEAPVPTLAPQLSVSITITNVDYGTLAADESLRISIQDAVSAAVAAGAEICSGDVAVVLSPGSVIADVAVVVPEDTTVAAVLVALEDVVSDGSLAAALAGELELINGFTDITTGAVAIIVSSPVLTSAPTPSPTPAPSSVPTPAPSVCSGSAGNCTIHDDPHITVFDGKQISLLNFGFRSVDTARFLAHKDLVGSGDMWLVKSSSVSIQARYAPNADLAEESMFVRAVAVGGPFLHGCTLVIEPLNGSVTWNGTEILASSNSTFSAEGLISAERGLNSRLVQDPQRTNPGIDIALPDCVSLTVNRQQAYVNVLVRMPRALGAQDGLCGNFNGRGEDDALELIMRDRSPHVQPGESLFDIEFDRRRARLTLGAAQTV